LSGSRYVVRPTADQDLDDQAFYYGTEASQLGHWFLAFQARKNLIGHGRQLLLDCQEIRGNFGLLFR
jgi:hypothetical protein